MPTSPCAATVICLLELLTPIVKAWGSDYSLKANELAIQVLGGYGFTREYPVEQNYRDNRINPIHEGTNGIQALDLLGRKAMMENGAALMLLLTRIERTCERAAAFDDLKAYVEQLRAAASVVADATRAAGGRMQAGEARLALANATHYMTALGHLTIGWLWLWQAAIGAARAARRDRHRSRLLRR